MERVSWNVTYQHWPFSETCRSRRILRGLKEDCTGMNGNKDFWTELQKLGRRMSLISSTDAQRVGGISDVSESDAEVVSVRFFGQYLLRSLTVVVVGSLCNNEYRCTTRNVMFVKDDV